MQIREGAQVDPFFLLYCGQFSFRFISRFMFDAKARDILMTPKVQSLHDMKMVHSSLIHLAG